MKNNHADFGQPRGMHKEVIIALIYELNRLDLFIDFDINDLPEEIPEQMKDTCNKMLAIMQILTLEGYMADGQMKFDPAKPWIEIAYWESAG